MPGLEISLWSLGLESHSLEDPQESRDDLPESQQLPEGPESNTYDSMMSLTSQMLMGANLSPQTQYLES